MTGKKVMMNENEKYEMRIAGLARQILILTWKNLIIFKCNLFGTVLEFLSPFVFLAFLLIIRYYIERIRYNSSLFNQPNSVLDISFFLMNQTRNLVIYYPNNTLIRNFVISAVQLLKFKNPTFDPKGSNVSTAFGLDQATIAQLAVQYSFPASYVNVLPNNIEYTIYTQEDSIFKYKVNSLFPDPVDYKYGRAPEDYCHDSTNFALYSSFNAFKFSMDLQIISYLTGTPIDNTNMLKTMAFNCPYYEQDEYHSTFAFFPCILIAVGFMFSTLFSLGQIVHEKSTKMKEYLKLVGIKWYAIWISWWIRNIFVFLILSVTVTILSRIVLRPTNNSPLFAEKAVLMSTDPLILLLLLLTYSVQVCSFIILFSQFFKKPFDAKVSMLILWVATSINFYNYLPSSVLKYLLCIFPNMGLQFGFQVIFQFERSSRPLGLPQLFTNIYEDPLNLGAIMLTMIVWSIFYLPVTWYMEKIMPGDYGVPLPYYFPFLKSYWFPEFSNTETLGRINSYHVGNQSFERDPKGLQKTVKIMNLSKTFKTFRTSKTVVKNVSINFFENQITGLLGHNGAGKTTTTFMLCGLYPPSSGTAQIFGYDLRTQMDKIRCIMGYCPQVNILFDEFTVEEHLKLIAMIKGFPKLKIDDEIIRISTFVGLSRDLSKKSKNLSGGMKRRLMVAMALMGDSKIIILDEPTSGLDPFNRVKLWELIRKYKNGRTIILTTHFMEEADALSDRIAIMNHGEIRCYGTPLFLKNYYGNGFRVKIVKNLRFNYGEFEALISSYLKEFSVETNVAAELCVSFGFDKVKILPEFLNQLEIDKDVIGIDSYSVSSSTLEEVFLKVGKIDQKYDENDNFNDFINVNENAFNSFKEKSVLKSGRALWVQQIQSLLYKRFVVFCRRYILGGMILILPIIFQLILAIIIPSSSAVVDEIGQTVKSEGRVSLDVRNYGSQELVYDLNGSPSPKVHQLFDQFYTYSTRPKVNPVQINGSVVDYVYDKQLNNMVAFIKGHYFGIEWYSPDSDVNKFDIVAYYSKLAYHTPGAVVNEISNLLLSYLNRNKLDETITTYNEPIIPSYSKYYGNDFLKYLGCFDILPLSIFNFSISLLLSFVISINVMHIAREKINGSKKMQILSNTSKVVYWISNYIFDITIYLINLVSILAVILIVSKIKNDPETDIYLISSYPTLPNLIFVVFLSSLSWPIYTYCWVNFFKSDVTAFAILLILLGVAGFADVLFSFVHIFIHVTEPDLDFDSPGSLMVYAVRILLTILFPNVTIKRELFNFRVRSNRYCISSLNRVIKTNLKYNAAFLDFEEPGVGLFILISFFQIIISILLLIGIETNSLNREFIKNFFYRLVNKNVKYIKINYTIESDVRSEIERVTSSNLKDLAKTEPLVVNRIVKLFKKKQMYFAAVDNLSFGVKAQRCFGLLGLNGAGKTTTFNMIIGEKEPDLGDVYINGYSIQGSQAQARQNLGYCPQFDRLVEYLTVEETLKMFSRLRGIEPSLADKISKDMLDIFQLQEFKGTLVQNLSGGNKRKVSCAIAFIGKPSVVILDEPSTGMDPGARKFLWNIIKKARDLGITIVLSSHSMEECEALCDKLAIMLNGQMQCFGTIPELKSRYGDGYRLIIKCNHSESLERDILVLDNFIRMNFPTAFLEDKQYETLFYIVRSSDDDENENESNGDDENNNNNEEDYEEVDEEDEDDMDEMEGETEVYEEDEMEPKPIKLKIDQENKKKKRRKKKKKDKKNKSQMQNLSRMFSLIETNKKFLNIESYYISQTTLEQLFMSFANRSYQIDESQFRQNSFSLYLNKHRRRRRRKAKVSQLDSEVQLSSTQFQSNQTDNQTNTTAVTSQIVLLSFRQFEEQPAAYVPSKKNVNDQYYF